MSAVLLGAGGAAAAALGLGIYQSTRYAWWTRPRPWTWPRVLMYHMVCDPRPGTRFNKLRVPPAQFERQVRWLKAQGFTFVPASALIRPADLPPKPVCLTFDDGYRDNLEHADPVLERYGACATLYLVGDRSGGWSSKKKAHHADDELADEPKLSDDEVRQLVATGRWELGGHTRTHANLPALGDDEAQSGINYSRTQFPDTFGVPRRPSPTPLACGDHATARLACRRRLSPRRPRRRRPRHRRINGTRWTSRASKSRAKRACSAPHQAGAARLVGFSRVVRRPSPSNRFRAPTTTALRPGTPATGWCGFSSSAAGAIDFAPPGGAGPRRLAKQAFPGRPPAVVWVPCFRSVTSPAQPPSPRPADLRPAHQRLG